MKKSNKAPKFLVTSPANYLDETSKRKQISSARSHVASHRHARERLRGEGRSPPVVAERVQEPSADINLDDEPSPAAMYRPSDRQSSISSPTTGSNRGYRQENDDGLMQGLIDEFGSSTIFLDSVASISRHYPSPTRAVDVSPSVAIHEHLARGAQTSTRFSSRHSQRTITSSENAIESMRDSYDALRRIC